MQSIWHSVNAGFRDHTSSRNPVMALCLCCICAHPSLRRRLQVAPHTDQLGHEAEVPGKCMHGIMYFLFDFRHCAHYLQHITLVTSNTSRSLPPTHHKCVVDYFQHITNALLITPTHYDKCIADYLQHVKNALLIISNTSPKHCTRKRMVGSPA